MAISLHWATTSRKPSFYGLLARRFDLQLMDCNGQEATVAQRDPSDLVARHPDNKRRSIYANSWGKVYSLRRTGGYTHHAVILISRLLGGFVL